uniref:Uncharacterized protein n=1 Tax=Amphimedon queenslandica TaxID=400682 RepID=A0A1X7US80_AMPQE
MKAQILFLVATVVAVFASSIITEECGCGGSCMKTVTEDGQCNTGYSLGPQGIGPWKCCKELGGAGYYFYGGNGAPAFCQPCDTVAPNNTGVMK